MGPPISLRALSPHQEDKNGGKNDDDDRDDGVCRNPEPGQVVVIEFLEEVNLDLGPASVPAPSLLGIRCQVCIQHGRVAIAEILFLETTKGLLSEFSPLDAPCRDGDSLSSDPVSTHDGHVGRGGLNGMVTDPLSGVRDERASMVKLKEREGVIGLVQKMSEYTE
jgi:hypothetical protein